VLVRVCSPVRASRLGVTRAGIEPRRVVDGGGGGSDARYGSGGAGLSPEE